MSSIEKIHLEIKGFEKSFYQFGLKCGQSLEHFRLDHIKPELMKAFLDSAQNIKSLHFYISIETQSKR